MTFNIIFKPIAAFRHIRNLVLACSVLAGVGAPAEAQSPTPSPTNDQQTEVQQLRDDVRQLRAEVARLTLLISKVSSVDSTPSTTKPVTGAAQTTAATEDPKVALATKSQGGDLSGAGNLLKTDRITIGGYGEVQYRDSPVSERADGGGTPTFMNPRLVLGIGAVLSEKQNIVFNSEIEYEFGSREIDVEQAFVEWRMRPELAVRGGIFVPSIGRFNTYHDSNLNLAIIRPLINQFIVPTAYRDTGVGIRGRFKLPGRMRLSYEADVVNGMQGKNADGEPTPFSRLLGQSSAAEPGTIAFQDPNRNKALVGRVALSPMRGMEFGLSGYTGKFEDEGSEISANIVFVDASYNRRNLVLNAEYGRSNIVGGGILRQSPAPPNFDPNDPASIHALSQFVAQRTPGQDGFYVEGSYLFHPSFLKSRFDKGAYLAPVVRYEVARLDRTLKDFYLNRSRATLGLNFAPSASVIFKANYLFNHPFGKVPNADAGIGGAIFGESPLPHRYYGRNGFTAAIVYIF